MALITTEKYARFQNSQNPKTLILLNSVVDASPLDIQASPLNNNQPEYQIVFTLSEPDSREKTQVIKYAGNNTQRDTDLAAFFAATTVVI